MSEPEDLLSEQISYLNKLGLILNSEPKGYLTYEDLLSKNIDLSEISTLIGEKLGIIGRVGISHGNLFSSIIYINLNSKDIKIGHFDDSFSYEYIDITDNTITSEFLSELLSDPRIKKYYIYLLSGFKLGFHNTKYLTYSQLIKNKFN